MGTALALVGGAAAAGEPVPADQRGLLDTMPPAVAEKARAKRAEYNAGATLDPLVGVQVPKLKWSKPTLNVAFEGGTQELRTLIEATAKEWTRNSKSLRFSFRDASGNFRTWSKSDSDRANAADVRIGFDERGYWAEMGVIATLFDPWEKTMNLGGYDQLDATQLQEWRDSLRGQASSFYRHTVLHEFGHVLGFAHEQLHIKCKTELLLDPSPGYANTFVDPQFVFAQDLEFRDGPNGESPGIYKYYSGVPTRWPKDDTQFQFDRDAFYAATAKSAKRIGIVGAITPYETAEPDKTSVMLYDIPAFLLRSGAASPCYISGYAPVLSPTDRKLMEREYP